MFSKLEKLKLVYIVAFMRFLFSWRKLSIKFNQSDFGKCINRIGPYALGLFIILLIKPVTLFIMSITGPLFTACLFFSSGIIANVAIFMHPFASLKVRADLFALFVLPLRKIDSV